MKNSSLGSLIAASALAVAPSAAFAQEATTPSAATTPEPAPVLTTPAATGVVEAPQATDPVIEDAQGSTSKRRERRQKEAQDAGRSRTEECSAGVAGDGSVVDWAVGA